MEGLEIIGVFAVCNTGGICVHALEDDRVLVSMNGEEPEWYPITEVYMEATEEVEPGFYFGSLFVPFCEVMRA